MKKKNIIILIVIVAIIIAIGVAIKIGLDYHKEAIIRSEVKEINKVFDEPNTDIDINDVFERRFIDKGDYEKVENAIKLYYKDLYSNFKNIDFLLDTQNEYNYLVGTNLRDDGPDFTKSHDMILNTKAQIEDYYNLFLKYLTDEDVKLSYITDKKLDRYYINFYLELANEIDDEALKNSMLSEYNSTLNKLNVYEEALNFLTINSGHWSIKNDSIVFDSTEYYTDYIKITDKLNGEEVSE